MLYNVVFLGVIIGAWVHFLYAYSYSWRQIRTVKFLAYMAICFGAVWTCKVFMPVQLAYPLIVALFMIHNLRDMYMLGYARSAWLVTVCGLICTAYFAVIASHVAVYGIWLVATWHYWFWYVYQYKKHTDNQKNFLTSVVVVHIAVIALAYSSYTMGWSTSLLFSVPVFYFMTLHHVLYSYIANQKRGSYFSVIRLS